MEREIGNREKNARGDAIQARPPLQVPASHRVHWVAAAFLPVLSPGSHAKQAPVRATGAYVPSSQSTHSECVRLAY